MLMFFFEQERRPIPSLALERKMDQSEETSQLADIKPLWKEVDGQKFYNYMGTWYRWHTAEDAERFRKQREELKKYDKKIDRFYKAMDILECDLLDLYNKKRDQVEEDLYFQRIYGDNL
jgi:hypothetical protein